MVDFTDLDDFDNVKVSKTATVEESIEKWTSENVSAQGAIYEEKCPSCGGSGKFRSYTGRIVGACFKCDGTGVIKFKTSPETRAKRKAKAEEKKAERQAELGAKLRVWVDANKEMYAFLANNSSWSEFYNSMLDNLHKFGSLTEKQMAAVQRGMDKAAERAKAQEKRIEEAPVVSALINAFNAAIESGLKRPKLRLLDMDLSLAPVTGKNAGHIYVRYQEEYAGKVTPEGKFIPVRSCPQEAIDRVAQLGEDVLEQAIAYGKETGNCCCCGRHLENEESVKMGIGPICAGRWGL